MSTILIPATSPPTTVEVVKTKLADLERELAAMPDSRDVLQTERAQTTHYAKQNSLVRRMSVLRNAVVNLPKLEAEHDAIATWISNLTAWRAEFLARLDALPPRAADLTREQQTEQISIATSIRNVDFGCEAWNGRHAVGQALAHKIREHYHPTWTGGTDPWTYGHGPLPAANAKLEDVRQQLEEVLRAVQAAMVEPEPTT